MRFSRGRLRPLWVAASELLARSLARYLSRGLTAGAYVAGTLGRGEPVPGLSDLDLVLVTAGGEVGDRIAGRWAALIDRLPRVQRLVDVSWFSQAAVAELGATCFAYGLGVPQPPALFFEPREPINLATRPGLWPTQEWRHVSGPDLRPRIDPALRDRRRLVVWLEVQFLWRFAFRAASDPEVPGSAYMCVKLIADLVKIVLWLERDEQQFLRHAALKRGLQVLPEERSAIALALGLDEDLHRVRRAPWETVFPGALRLSSRIERRLTEEIGEPGTRVDLAFERGGSAAAELPLCDWPALVHPAFPEESFELSSARSLGEPEAVAAAVTRSAAGHYPSFRHERLLLRPSLHDRGKLRVVASPISDPVSAALAVGRTFADFPDAPGWSAADVAARAVAEHRAWLAPQVRLWKYASEELLLKRLAGAMSAARAALFAQSLAGTQPELAVGFDDVARSLSAHAPERAEAIWEAHESYRRLLDRGERPPHQVVNALTRTVQELPAYAA